MNAPVARSSLTAAPAAVEAPAPRATEASGTLPPGEALLWQGSPDWASMASRVFHLRGLSLYFAALWLWQAGTSWRDDGFAAALHATGVSFLLGGAALGVLAFMGWLMARSTVYTITTRRVVMQIGVALPMACNVPFKVVEKAAIARHPEGTADLSLGLKGGDRFAYLALWPHVRAWRIARPEPMLRCIRNADEVARILAEALNAYTASEAPPRIVLRPTNDVRRAESSRHGAAA